jgi:hypothetical protein
MTGGYGMHIHSYQIHNVLNVYRQRLSRGTAREKPDTPERSKAAQDMIDISDHGQRQSLFEMISSEIVQRITQVSPDTETETAFSGQSAGTTGPERDTVAPSRRKNQVFSYTLIDHNNQKTTHNLSIRQLNYSTEKINSLPTAPSDSHLYPGSE